VLQIQTREILLLSGLTDDLWQSFCGCGKTHFNAACIEPAMIFIFSKM
jgi:hypothetical protein